MSTHESSIYVQLWEYSSLKQMRPYQNKCHIIYGSNYTTKYNFRQRPHNDDHSLDKTHCFTY